MKYNYIHSLYPQIFIQSAIISQKIIDNQYKMEKEQAEIITNNNSNAFLNSLNEKELKAYAIANSFLKDTFDINKSNGFIKWKSLNELKKQTNDEKNL